MVKNYFKSIRLLNLALLSFIFWGLMLNLYNSGLEFKIDHFLLFLSITATTASGYLINNYYDIKSDELNNKFIQGLRTKYFISSYFIHFLISYFFIFISNLSGGWLMVITLVHILLYLYSLKLQHFPLIGNAIVCALCAVVILIPHSFSNETYNFKNLNVINNILVVYAIFCFLVTLKREIIKDMEDIEGDRIIGSNTLPVVIGLRMTKLFTAIVVLIEIIFLVLCFIQTPTSMNSILFFMTQLVVILIFCYQLYFSENQQNFKSISNLLKIQFLLAGVWLYIP
jgi:4-hydroxybenzoate polyprenyltransferase